jgi:hypothetical protein
MIFDRCSQSEIGHGTSADNGMHCATFNGIGDASGQGTCIATSIVLGCYEKAGNTLPTLHGSQASRAPGPGVADSAKASAPTASDLAMSATSLMRRLSPGFDQGADDHIDRWLLLVVKTPVHWLVDVGSR